MNHTIKEIIENWIPTIDPPSNIIEIASRVPKLPGANEGIKVTNPNNNPTIIVVAKIVIGISKPINKK